MSYKKHIDYTRVYDLGFNLLVLTVAVSLKFCQHDCRENSDPEVSIFPYDI